MKVQRLSNKEFFDLVPEHMFRDEPFLSPSWLTAFGDQIRYLSIRNDEQLIALAALWRGGRPGIRSLITPPFTPHIPMVIFDHEKKKEIVQSLIDYCRSERILFYAFKFPPGFDRADVLAPDVRVQERITYRIDLRKRLEEIEAAYDSTQRNVLRKAEKEGYIISEGFDPAVCIPMISDHLRSKGVRFESELLDNLINSLGQNGRLFQISVRVSGRVGWTGVFAFSEAITYYLFGVMDRGIGSNALSPAGIHFAIKTAKTMGSAVFDFEGSQIPGIARFFKSFGGEQVSYFEVTGGRWLWPDLFRWRQRKKG